MSKSRIITPIKLVDVNEKEEKYETGRINQNMYRTAVKAV